MALRRFAAIAQLVERILGKDEVISSNLISSSRKSTVNGALSFCVSEWFFAEAAAQQKQPVRCVRKNNFE